MQKTKHTIKLSFADEGFENRRKNFHELSNKELINSFDLLKISFADNSILEFLAIVSECFERVFSKNLSQKDFEIFEKFLNGTSLNIKSNEEIFNAFLIYSAYVQKTGKKLHCLFINRFLLIENYIKAKEFFDFLKVKISINLTASKAKAAGFEAESKEEIYEKRIIFSSWEEILYDYVFNLNIEKFSERINIKFENAFIFDIERILYDFENCIFKISGHDLEKDEIEIKKIFDKYEKIIGVSAGLIFEKEKLAKKFNLNVENFSFDNKIEEFLKNPKDIYHPSRDEKIKALFKEIEKCHKENKTVVVDIDSKEDLALLEDFLSLKKIKYSLIDDDTIDKQDDAARVLTEKRITLFTNLIGVFLKPKTGGDYKKIAKSKTDSYNISFDTNFYKEKLKSELKKEKENSTKAAKKIKEKGIKLIFASHYLELKNEYLVINNYPENLNPDEIIFYNCPQDEIFREFRLENLKILNTEATEQNQYMFRIISKFLYRLKKYSLKKLLKQDCAYLVYLIENVAKEDEKRRVFKIGRNDPCYCGSGLKYKKCCGKTEGKVNDK